MSVQVCPICDVQFKHGDELAAVVLSTFVDIPSDVAYAITEPRKCLEIIHSDCYDWEEHDARRDE